MFGNIFQSIREFLSWTQDGLWRIRLADQSTAKRVMLRWLRIVMLTARKYGDDDCGQRASALTFYAVLSIVPLAAMAFGVAKGFGFERRLETTIRDNLQGQEQAADLIIEFSRDQLAQAQGGIIAGVGILALIWIVVRLLSNIELALNNIWGVTRQRTWPRKFTDYLAVLLIAPIVVITASSATVYISGTLENVANQVSFGGLISGPLTLLVRLLPATLLWALFTFVYMFLPNTRVRLLPALTAAILTGTVYQITQVAYVYFQFGVSKYSAIYGSLAALPLFLVWMQLSWMIVLFGAEFAYAQQNVRRYEFLDDDQHMSAAFRRLFALGIAQIVVREFLAGNSPPDDEALTDELKTAPRAVRELLGDLVGIGILAESATGDERAPGYLPALPPEQLTLAEVLRRLDGRGGPELPLAQTDDLQRLRDALEAYERVPLESDANRPLSAI